MAALVIRVAFILLASHCFSFWIQRFAVNSSDFSEADLLSSLIPVAKSIAKFISQKTTTQSKICSENQGRFQDRMTSRNSLNISRFSADYIPTDSSFLNLLWMLPCAVLWHIAAVRTCTCATCLSRYITNKVVNQEHIKSDKHGHFQEMVLLAQQSREAQRQKLIAVSCLWVIGQQKWKGIKKNVKKNGQADHFGGWGSLEENWPKDGKGVTQKLSRDIPWYPRF